jgi:cell division topological specificity factor
MGWLTKLFNLGNNRPDSDPNVETPKSEACNRLKLVLMHDRTQLSPHIMEAMRDDLVEVISKYVVIDKNALDLSLENETSTIALVANIPVLRARTT